MIVFNTPSEQPSPAPYLTLDWPINQSKLYNLLKTLTKQSTKPKPEEKLFAPEGDVQGRILIVDDYRDNIELITSALNGFAVEIDVVEDGQQALDKLAQHAYDLVLMDIQMPVMDGVTATQHIRASESDYADIPIIALTASVMRHQKDKYLANGINRVIAKPFSLKQIRKEVRYWLAKPNSNDV